MNCNCTCEQNTIRAVVGKSINIEFTFNTDISSYSNAHFVVRKDYGASPVINKNITGFSGNTLELNITPAEMSSSVFNEFLNGKNQAKYIWGLDFEDTSNNIVVPAFPNIGESAPLFIVYKSVTEVQNG